MAMRLKLYQHLNRQVITAVETLGMLGNFPCFFVVSRYFYIKFNFSNRPSSILAPGQAQCFVGPDLAKNYLQRLATDNKSPLLAREDLI